MKNKIIGGIAILAIAAVAAFNVNINSKSESLSSASLANIEALAAPSELETLCGGCSTSCSGTYCSTKHLI